MKRKLMWAIIGSVCFFNFGQNIWRFLPSISGGKKSPASSRGKPMLKDLPTIGNDNDDTIQPVEKLTTSFIPRVLIMDDFGTRKMPNIKHARLQSGNATQNFEMIPHRLINSDTSAERLREFERDWFEQCEPSLKFHIRPICNSIHELDASFNFIPNVLSMDGSWRSVLKVNDQAIIKVLHLHRLFDEESFQKHEMDNGVMERLTGSPYVVSSFGFCGQSVVTPYARASGKLVAKDKTLRKIERLRLARNLARGLAELHSMQRINFDKISRNNTSMPLYFAHHDINIANTITVKEKSIIWNDFNLGIVSKHYKFNKNVTCDAPIRYQGNMWRSPEEIRNATNGTLRQIQPSDVYSFGNILFHILVKHQPWTHLEEPPEPNLTHVANLKLQGHLPNLPEKYQPKYLELNVLWKAVKACFRLDPSHRPSALHLAQAFQTAYQWAEDKKVASRIKEDAIEKLFAVDSVSK
jgi:serine/threonine protein kinase